MDHRWHVRIYRKKKSLFSAEVINLALLAMAALRSRCGHSILPLCYISFFLYSFAFRLCSPTCVGV